MPSWTRNEAAETTEIVLLPGELFTDLFTEPEGPRDTLNVAGYKHMAHVKKDATDGMTNSGSGADEALFSVLVSRRTGPIESDAPSMMIAHLLSLSWDGSMPFPKPEDRVAVTSLYSWTYTCLPSMLTNPSQHITVLRADGVDVPIPREGGEQSDGDRVAELMTARQRDGYALTRHHTATGEVTAAVFRGPVVPRRIDSPRGISLPIQSNHGHDLAVFDPNLGLLDITYSSAWQLGKTLALEDYAFCVAVARLRTSMERSSAFGDDGHGPRHDLGGMLGHPRAAAMRFAIAPRLNKTGLQRQRGQNNEENIATNPDFAAVYSWILDKVQLGNIPAQYLIPGPAFLPEETVRFFYVDAYWTDALIDGALNLTNHLGLAPDKDAARTAIKEAIKKCLTTPDATIGRQHVQMPRCGLLIRTALLVQFPDMAINLKSSEITSQPNILIQKRIAPDAMYLLLDALPPGPQCITFTIPLHQRRFRIGESLTDRFLEVVVTELDTVCKGPSDVRPGDSRRKVKFFPDGKPANIVDWETRTLNSAIFAKYIVDQVGVRGTCHLTEDTPIFAIMALLLEVPILQLDIGNVCAPSTIN